MSSPPAAPPKPNNAIWWILTVLGGVVVLLVIAGLTAADLIIRHVNVRNSSQRVEIQTPVGDLQANRDGTDATGLPVYPGAAKGTDDDIAEGSADVSLGDEGLGIAAESYDSADSLDAVKTWYRSRLGPSFRLEAAKDERRILNRANFDMGDQDWAFVEDRTDATGLVALRRADNHVQITLLTVGKREAQ
jgi:hypothetical protein